jgi:hypothetical protein
MKKLLNIIPILFSVLAYGQFTPADFGIKGDGKPISQESLNNWFLACKNHSREIHFPAGTFCFPINFQYDFGDFDLTLIGERGKTIITTYDSTSETNFKIPGKINITKFKPQDGVYQIDVTGLPYPVINENEKHNIIGHISSDFKDLADKSIDAYLIISGGVVSNLSLSQVKTLGYVTELNTSDPDTGIDGLYVVSKHRFFSYGGGFAHLNLKYANAVSGALSKFDTNEKNVFYVQGTILQRKNGKWSRYYTSGGFGTKKNLVAKDIIFDNVQFYIFSPFDLTGKTTCKTSDKFSIDHCIFKNCYRILSSSTYAGIDQDSTWYKMSQVYDSRGQFRFNDFAITNNDFSYIHQSIVWAAPPSKTTTISGNNVHDCYTILTTFYLLMTAVVSDYWNDKITQSVTNNSFIDIRPLNAGANWATNIIRTTGYATVNNNRFLNITQQAVFLSGSNSIVSNNIIIKFIDDNNDYTSSPVILCKLAPAQTDNIVSGNIIISPLSSLVAMEGGASFLISNNSYIGCMKARYITSTTTNLSIDRIYIVQNISMFQKLANTDPYFPAYDTTIVKSDKVYFNKRTGTWKKLLAVIPVTYVFSKNNDIIENNQCLKITGNNIESENITNVSSKKIVLFKYIEVSNNIIYCSILHTGNNTTVDEYFCSGNNFRGSINITSVTPLYKQIKNLFFENNKIAKNFLGILSLWAYHDLIFKGNVLFEDENWKPQSVYDDFGVTAKTPDYGIVLKGSATSKIIADNNSFISAQSGYSGLTIEEPHDADIKNNTFVLNTKAFQTPDTNPRCAVYIKNSTVINTLLFTGNTIFPQPGKSNFIIQFDNFPGTIATLLIDGNKVPVYQDAITCTVFGINKTITTYLKGTNLYPAISDKFKLVKTIK